MSYPVCDNGRTMNGIVNASEAPAHGAFIGRFGAAGLCDLVEGSYVSNLIGCNGSAGVLACEFGRRLVARRGTWRDAPQTRCRDGGATLADAARSDRRMVTQGVPASCGSSRFFREIPTKFFSASALDLHSQVVENQRSDYSAVAGRRGRGSSGIGFVPAWAEAQSTPLLCGSTRRMSLLNPRGAADSETRAWESGPRPHGRSYSRRRWCLGIGPCALPGASQFLDGSN